MLTKPLSEFVRPPHIVPIFSDFIRMTGIELPPPAGSVLMNPGVSPGKALFLPLDFPAEFETLPNLFPLDQQEIFPPQVSTSRKWIFFGEIEEKVVGPSPDLRRFIEIANIAASSTDIVDFVGTFITYALRNITGLHDNEMRVSQAEELQGIDEITVNDIPLGEFDFKNMKLDDILVGEQQAPVFDFGNTNFLNQNLEPFINEMTQHFINGSRLYAYAGEYHFYPTVAYTFFHSAS